MALVKAYKHYIYILLSVKDDLNREKMTALYKIVFPFSTLFNGRLVYQGFNAGAISISETIVFLKSLVVPFILKAIIVKTFKK